MKTLVETSARMQGIQKSMLRRFAEKAKPGSINLGLGQLEFPLPVPVMEAGIAAFREGRSRYTANAGASELRAEIARDSNLQRGTNHSRENVVVNSGAEEALFTALFCTVNPGDKVILFEPAYPAYESILSMLGAKICRLPLTSQFEVDFNVLEGESRDAVAVIANFPANPTGATLSKAHAHELALLSEKNGFLLISDEVYFSLYLDGPSSSPSSFMENCVVIDGISKRASATGLRLGWTLAPKSLVPSLEAAHQYITTSASSISQWAALAALRHSGYEEGFRSALRKRRDVMLEEFAKWKVGSAVKPSGAFYFFPDLSELGAGTELAEKIIANGVSVVPGEAFGSAGAGHIRVSFAASEEDIRKGMKLIGEAIL